MPAPSKSFTVIADTDVDPDSPLTTGLMTALRDNDIHLEEWLGKDYTAAQNHTHDGVDSALVSVSGAGLHPSLRRWIFDHFLSDAIDTTQWATSGTPTSTMNQHYCLINSGEALSALHRFRLDQVESVFECRARQGTGTNFVQRFGIEAVGTRQAVFMDSATAVAEVLQFRTVGTAGTQDTDVTAPGGGVDAWHRYKIDLRNSASILAYLDDVLVATHATAVPDSDDLYVELAGGTNDLYVDWVRWYATVVDDSTA